MINDSLIPLVIVSIAWIISITAFIVRIAMRLGFLEREHKNCQQRRVLIEDRLTLVTADIKDTLSVLSNDIAWIKDQIKKNGNK